MRIAISIPVHEAPEVVVNQLDNILGSTHDTVVVLHVSASAGDMADKLTQLAAHYLAQQRLWINPERLATHAHSILQPHVRNFLYLSGTIDFDYICFQASNDLLIRPRLDKFLVRWDAGLRCGETPLPSRHWYFPQVAADEQLRAILRRREWDADHVVISQIEGSFYRRELVQDLIEIIDREYIDYRIAPYPKEEIVLPTLFCRGHSINALKITAPYVFVPWGRRKWFGLGRTDYDATRRDVDRLLSGQHPSRPDHECVFGVKRVARRLDDPLRQYISKQVLPVTPEHVAPPTVGGT